MKTSKSISNTWSNTKKKYTKVKSRKAKWLFRKRKDKLSFRMLSARYAQMETTQMIISLSSALHATSACINDVLDWLKFPQKVGYVMSVWHLDLQASTCPALCAMWKEEQWKEQTFISTQTYGKRQIQATMNILKNVLTINKNKNTFILKKSNIRKRIMKIMRKASRKKKNCIMIILIRALIHKTNLAAIMSGSTTCARFGFLNAILNRKMVLSMWRVLRTLRRRGTNTNALCVRNLKLELAWNAKTSSAENTTIPNAQERRKFIWSN